MDSAILHRRILSKRFTFAKTFVKKSQRVAVYNSLITMYDC
jgi:hypothetical protein